MQIDRSEKVARSQLGDSFEVRTICWRLQKIHAELSERCRREQRPLRVLSICDGIAGCLAALNREAPPTHPPSPHSRKIWPIPTVL
jgi:hypothetical protein